MSELGKIVWRTPLFCLVLHEIRVGRALALRYTELSRSGDFSGSLLSPSVCSLTPLLGINRVFSLFLMKVLKFPAFGKHHCRSSSCSLSAAILTENTSSGSGLFVLLKILYYPCLYLSCFIFLMCVYVICVWNLMETKRRCRATLHGCWDPNLGLLDKSYGLSHLSSLVVLF